MDNPNPDDVTRAEHRHKTLQDEAVPDQHPERIGRYRIKRVLGRGGFGLVYLAHDEQLERPVAVKVPHASLISQPEDAEAYLIEARTVANLDHAHIVPVHDIGSTDDCPYYVVSKYIEGTDLYRKLKRHRFKYSEAAELVATVAEALGYAHKQGLVHRDVKPSNILIDKSGQPHVVDFGLALREENIGNGPRNAGTPCYMSPEQARGEGHRVDGRSDIFGLGIVFYELLIGRRPFGGDTKVDLFEQITSYEPRPLRQYDEKLPRELERICHKAMSKRASERYSSAYDLAADLRHFLVDQTAIQSDITPGTSGVMEPDSEVATPISSMVDSATGQSASSGSSSTSDSQFIRIVPKGLRSFDAHDADFFLELLPGPRDRDGLPDSLRFWKTRVEETDPDNTFSVGLIYGPSGCGKSSLVKAGLLPRLSEDVIPVYIEATPDETEARLLRGLQKRCPALQDNLTLTDTMAALRRGQGIPVGKKVLIVLDQFEQWLHAKKEEENCDLVQALRQCDGGRVQCIVMVRDDFWLAVSRFLRELEIRLVEGENIALADLFDLEHARKVLAAFGRAFGKLPLDSRATTNEQKAFCKQSVASLAEEGKVICVRLALFAEMLRGKSWTPATLKEVGGTKGIGLNFLEETFSSSAASPEHRYHQKAVRAVLKALPESGTNIKGEMKSYDKLLDASGYASRARDFDDLIKILDSEVRLITPTDPDGMDSDDVSDSRAEAGQKYYQLTHDYLVPSLRDWLTRKQQETRRGRAELKLAEWSALWNAKPDNRHLPPILEWISIRCLTDAKQWSETQRTMMRQAARVQLTIWGTTAVVLLVVAVSIQQHTAKLRLESNIKRTESLVRSMQAAEGAAVPVVTQALEQLPRKLVLQELRNRYGEASSQQKLSLAYGLAQFGEVEFDTILLGLFDADTEASEMSNIITAFHDRKAQALEKLRAAVTSATEQKDWKAKSRLAIVAWHLGEKSIANEMLRTFPQGPTTKNNLSNHMDGSAERLQDLEKAPYQPWDPVQRTTFIAEFADWSGDAGPLAAEVGEDEVAHLRSGISLALGGVKRPSAEAKAAWIDLLSRWHSKAPDSGSHSAAGWALAQWKSALPTIAATARPEGGQDWWHMQEGLTMVKIPAGDVQGDDGPVKVDKEFWLSNHETTVRLFLRFMKDTKYDGLKPTWDGPYVFEGLSAEEQLDHPVQEVNWYDAVMFCNWMSEQHRLDRCYEIEAMGSAQSGEYKVLAVADANGFRLPTALEWEYACRDMTTTTFSFGDDEAYLQLYGNYTVNSKSQTAPVGSFRCNAWGLFDVHGNVQEWCWDTYDASGSARVDRSGSWRRTARYCRSSYRYEHAPTLRSNTLGFRLAVGSKN